MKKLKSFISSPKGTLAIFGAAIGLLLFSSVGGARAALTYYSENHMTEIQTQRIDVELLENGNKVPANSDNTGKELLQGLVPEGEKFQIGKEYDESLSVENTGEIDQYVRVIIYTYWEGQDGEKVQTVDPYNIELTYANEDEWWKDTGASTRERTVLYCKKRLVGSESENIGDKVTKPFVTGLRINEKVGKIATEGVDGVTFDYQGKKFQVKVDVDAVQTHNAEDAILSSWGKNVTVNEKDGSLTFNG